MNIEELVKYYKNQDTKLNNKEKELRVEREKLEKLVEDNINFQEIDEKYNYLEAKEIIKTLSLYYTANSEALEFLRNKKEKEYPLIKEVHYFPEIREITWLSEEEKIKLDKALKEKNRRRGLAIVDKFMENEKTEEFLKDKNIIEKKYVLTCGCGCWDCEDRVVTEKELELYKKYWKDNTSFTDEEEEDIDYGVIYIYCEREGEIEITNMEEFNKHLSVIRYNVIKQPDMTLDLL